VLDARFATPVSFEIASRKIKTFQKSHHDWPWHPKSSVQNLFDCVFQLLKFEFNPALKRALGNTVPAEPY
jgi:hypothetical protein